MQHISHVQLSAKKSSLPNMTERNNNNINNKDFIQQ